MSSPSSLESIRAAMADVDAEIIALLTERVRLAVEAGAMKRAAGVPIVDPVQEARVLNRAAALARRNGLDEREVRALFQRVVSLARSAQLPAVDSP